LAGGAASHEQGVAPVVEAVCGVQAQDRRAAALAVRARTAGLTVGDVEREQVAERSLVRTWAMRGTFHLLAAEDVRWLMALLGPVFVAAGRRRFAELGLDEDQCARGVRAVVHALDRHGSRARAELADDLRAAGLPVDGGGRVVTHLVRRAALEGLLCVGPDRDGDEAYVLVDDWLPPGRRPALAGDAALAELGRRYLTAYGPAGPHDLAAWSGLPVARARRAWELLAGELTEVSVEGARAWVLSGRRAAGGTGGRGPSVRLLPAFDTYLLGYRRREWQLDDRHARRVWPGGGWIHPTLVVDGRVVATWRLSSTRVVVEPFEALGPALLPPLDREAADVGRFLGRSTALALASGDR
jgi:hypothetical protein